MDTVIVIAIVAGSAAWLALRRRKPPAERGCPSSCAACPGRCGGAS